MPRLLSLTIVFERDALSCFKKQIPSTAWMVMMDAASFVKLREQMEQQGTASL